MFVFAASGAVGALLNGSNIAAGAGAKAGWEVSKGVCTGAAVGEGANDPRSPNGSSFAELLFCPSRRANRSSVAITGSCEEPNPQSDEGVSANRSVWGAAGAAFSVQELAL